MGFSVPSKAGLFHTGDIVSLSPALVPGDAQGPWGGNVEGSKTLQPTAQLSYQLTQLVPAVYTTLDAPDQSGLRVSAANTIKQKTYPVRSGQLAEFQGQINNFFALSYCILEWFVVVETSHRGGVCADPFLHTTCITEGTAEPQCRTGVAGRCWVVTSPQNNRGWL